MFCVLNWLFLVLYIEPVISSVVCCTNQPVMVIHCFVYFINHFLYFEGQRLTTLPCGWPVTTQRQQKSSQWISKLTKYHDPLMQQCLNLFLWKYKVHPFLCYSLNYSFQFQILYCTINWINSALWECLIENYPTGFSLYNQKMSSHWVWINLQSTQPQFENWRVLSVSY